MMQLRCSCGMVLEVDPQSGVSSVECPHCGKMILAPLPDDPTRDHLIQEYAAGIEVKDHPAPKGISNTLLGVMRSALSKFRPIEKSGELESGRSVLIQAFHDTLIHGIARPGFKMIDEAQKLGLERKEVGAAVKDVYREFFRKCLEDGVLSGAEREALAVVAQRMSLHPAKRAELEAEVTGRLLRERFEGWAQDGRIEANEAEAAHALVRAAGQEWAAIVPAARDLGIRLVEQRFAFARADGVITREEAEEIRKLKDFFLLSGRDVEYIEQEMNAMRLLSAYQEGTLPVIEPPRGVAGIGEDEVCHAWEPIWLVTPPGPAGHEGVKRASLLITRKRVLIPGEGGIDLSLDALDPVREEFATVTQEGSVRSRRFLLLRAAGTRTGGARVTAHQHDRLRALIAGAIHNARRTAQRPHEAPLAQRVEAGVRTRVWVRDQGKCSVCGGTQELEFDRWEAGAPPDDPRAYRIVCRRCRG